MLKLSEQLKVLPADQYKAVVREDRDDGEWMSPELLPGSKFEVTHLEWDAEDKLYLIKVREISRNVC